MTDPQTYLGRLLMYAMHAVVLMAFVYFMEYVYSASLENGEARQEARQSP